MQTVSFELFGHVSVSSSTGTKIPQRDVDNRRIYTLWGQEEDGKIQFLSQFCYEPKTALENNIF